MVKIGLEIHIQLKTDAKLFCKCPTDYLDVKPNSNICPICTGQPGAKPMEVNVNALENLMKIGLALNCKIVDNFVIQRKHYFYPDLPSGYQRTSKPIGVEGRLGDVRIREVHIEEDPGRYEPRIGNVDYNRSGIPLIEIVTEPDIKSPEEARSFLEELNSIIDYLVVGRDEPGSSRIDANISLPKGARVEVKNINSFKGVYTALKYELIRQKNLITRGKTIERETRHFDDSQGVTTSLRKKETEEDYRFFPDPDIPAINISKEIIEKGRSKIPELPRAKAERLVSNYKIRTEDAWTLVSEIEMANLFEKMAKKFDPEKIAFWLRGPVKKQLNYRDLTLKKSEMKSENLIDLYKIWIAEEITEKGMEKVLIEMLDKKIKPNEAVKELGLEKIVNRSKIEKIVEKVLEKNEKVIRDYLAGEERALNFLIGQVSKETEGKIDSRVVKKIILDIIGKNRG